MYIYIYINAQSLNRGRLFATPWTIACQAPLSMECVCVSVCECVCVCVCVCSCLVAKSCPALLRSHGLQPIGSSVHGIPQARILEYVAISFSRGLPDSGVVPESPALAGGFLTTEPPRKPKQRLSDSEGSRHFARAQAWNP